MFLFQQVISLEGWTDVLYFVQDAHSFWNWLYFVLLIVVSIVYDCVAIEYKFQYRLEKHFPWANLRIAQRIFK